MCPVCLASMATAAAASGGAAAALTTFVVRITRPKSKEVQHADRKR